MTDTQEPVAWTCFHCGETLGGLYTQEQLDAAVRAERRDIAWMISGYRYDDTGHIDTKIDKILAAIRSRAAAIREGE